MLVFFSKKPLTTVRSLFKNKSYNVFKTRYLAGFFK